MGGSRRSARVAALDTVPDYTEPNESGLKRKKSDAIGRSPSAKRGRKSKSKENLKEQKTLDDAMDIDTAEEPKSEPTKQSDPPPSAPEEGKKPEPIPAVDEGKSQLTLDATTNDAPAETKEEEKPAEPEPKPQEPEQSSSAGVDKPEESSARTDGDATGSDSLEDGQTSIKAFVITTEDKPAEASKEAEKPEPEKEEKPVEEPKQDKPEPAEPSKSEETPAEHDKAPAASSDTNHAPTNGDQPSTLDTNGHAENKETATEPVTNGTNGTIDATARAGDVPSSILEKGIIYFFFRPRVNIDHPQDVTDIARSYLVLRPLPHGASLSDGPIPDSKVSRLIALPKKVLPLSGKDRFMAFVEKAKTSFAELKTDFMSASDYATKTVGTSHSPPVTPVAEGVYAITTTGRESHLAYVVTIPSPLSEVQRDIGLRDSGSFVVSVKNPKYPGPANANLGSDPGFSEEITSEFRDLRWMPLKPEVLDYVSAQVLLIGEKGIDGALEGLPRDEREGNLRPQEEIEKLEGEDEIRVRHLKGDDAIFKDLGLSKSEYPKVPSTW